MKTQFINPVMKWVLGVYVSFLVPLASFAELREWTDSHERKMEAELISVDGDTITLQRTDGNRGEVQRSDLSEADQSYVDEWTKEQKVDALDLNDAGGNYLTGIFYDLTKTADGKTSDIGKLLAGKGPHDKADKAAKKVVESFVRSGWRIHKLKGYYHTSEVTPRNDFYLTSFDKVGAKGSSDGDYWVCLYSGMIVPEKPGRYRFSGSADDFLMIRIDGKLVLDACQEPVTGLLSDWTSPERSNTYGSNEVLVVGDWFDLKDKPVQMEVLIGNFDRTYNAFLYVQQSGEQYRIAKCPTGQRRVLPLFQMNPISAQEAAKLGVNPDVGTVDGPVFGVKIN